MFLPYQSPFERYQSPATDFTVLKLSKDTSKECSIERSWRSTLRLFPNSGKFRTAEAIGQMQQNYFLERRLFL